MTYCVGIMLNTGLIFASDSHSRTPRSTILRATRFLTAMVSKKVDYTRLSVTSPMPPWAKRNRCARCLPMRQPTDLWSKHWRAQLARDSVAPSERAQAMRRVNPAFIARNHRVEEALSAAVERADYAPFETLVKILARPFDDQPEFAAFAEPAPKGKDATKPSAAPETHIRPLFAEGSGVRRRRMTLNPIPGTTLHNMIVEGLSMPAALKEKLKPILAPKA